MPASVPQLNDALQRLAAALGTQLPQLTASDVNAAWQKHKQQLVVAKQRETLAWRQLAGIVDRLRAEPLANLRPGAFRKHADQVAVDVDFAGTEGSLTLTVRAAETPDGRFLPRFQHAAEGLSAPTVAQFSQALGRRLRGAGAISPTA